MSKELKEKIENIEITVEEIYNIIDTLELEIAIILGILKKEKDKSARDENANKTKNVKNIKEMN